MIREYSAGVARATEGLAIGPLQQLAGLEGAERDRFWDNFHTIRDVETLKLIAADALRVRILDRVVSGELCIVCRPTRARAA